ncbi:MAG TPA: hypothetical protein VM054_06095, partial [bacterium]|nr:hypothetical protein [bacterium]
MTRMTILLLCALTFSATLGLTGAVGVSSPHRDDDLQVLWEEPYDFSHLSGGFGSWGPHYTQDDFTLATDAVLQAVECWAYYYPDEPDHHPQLFHVGLRYDHYGMPGEYYIASYCPHPKETFTGDVYLDMFPVYHYRLNLVDDIGVEAGTPFWLEIYSVAENFDWGIRNTGNLYYTWTQYDASAFFRLLGTPLDTDVQSASWGE